MRPAPPPPQVIDCPSCQRSARYTSWASGNTMGVVLWTDGRQSGPYLPSSSLVRRCPYCRTVVSARELQRSGGRYADDVYVTVDGSSLDGPDADLETWLNENDEALLEAAEDPPPGLGEHVVELRVRAWQADNDRVRRYENVAESLRSRGRGLDPDDPLDVRLEKEANRPRSARHEANLNALVPLLDRSDPDHLVIAAEALRELGRFEESVALLEADLPDEYTPARDRIATLARAGDSRVATVPMPSS